MGSKDSESEGFLFQLTPEQADRFRATLDDFYAGFSKTLSKRIDDILAPAQRMAAAAVAKALHDLRPAIGPLVERYRATLPDNWKGFESATEIGRIFDVMQTTGWCLVWAPREEVVREILAEEEDAMRSRILLLRREKVVADLRGVLNEVQSSELNRYRESAGKALSAFQDGHPEAAQALAATVMSAVIHSHMGYRSFEKARRDLGGDPWKHGVGTFRQAAVFNQVALSLQHYYEYLGDDVPTTFSRHATAHSVSPQQFTEINCFASLLLLGGFLRELESEGATRTRKVGAGG